MLNKEIKLNSGDIVAIQELLKGYVENEIRVEISKFPEKSGDERFLELNEASKYIQIGIAKLGKAIELNNVI